MAKRRGPPTVGTTAALTAAVPSSAPRADRRLIGADGSARTLLLTVLGELVFPNDDAVWTSALLYVLAGVGVEERSARQAISRAAAAGWITGERSGREVRWRLTPAGRRLIADGIKRVYSLAKEPPRWCGEWLVVQVSVPQHQRLVRKRLYAALSWAGFGNPTPGVWMSPYHERDVEAKQIIDDLDLKDSTLAYVGSSTSAGLSDQEIVRRSWDLDEVAKRYEQVLIKYSGLEPQPGDPILFTDIQLVGEWQRMPFLDPQLPEELLPDWIGRRAASVCKGLRARWRDKAHQRWREVVEETSPG